MQRRWRSSTTSFCSHDSWAWWYYALFSPGFTITKYQAMIFFFVSLIWVPVLWIAQLISVKFQGRNRQNNNNRRKDGVGGSSNAGLAHDFQKIQKWVLDWSFIDSCPCNVTLKEFWTILDIFGYITKNMLNLSCSWPVFFAVREYD